MLIENYVENIRQETIIDFKLNKNDKEFNLIKTIVELNYLHNTKIEIKDDSNIKISSCFSDYVKIKTLNLLKIDYKLSNKDIKQIALLMKYEKEEVRYDDGKKISITEAIEKLDKINNILVVAFRSPKLFKKLRNEYKEVFIKYRLEYEYKKEHLLFESSLYLNLYSKKYMFCIIGKGGFNKESINGISFVSGENINKKIISNETYIIIPLSKILEIEMNEKNKLMFDIDNIENNYKYKNKKEETLLKYKEKIEELWSKTKDIERKEYIATKEELENFNKLQRECFILECDIELSDFNYKRYENKIDNTSLNYDYTEDIKSIVEGTVSMKIKKSGIKEIKVYRKEKNKTQKELRNQYPFAEIGGYQHNGEHKFSTVKYKKVLKK